MKTITIEKGKFHLEDEIEEVVEGEVRKIGNGGMIMSSKKYVGKKVYVYYPETGSHHETNSPQTSLGVL